MVRRLLDEGAMAVPCPWSRIERARLAGEVLSVPGLVLLLIPGGDCASCRAAAPPCAKAAWRERVRCLCADRDAAREVAGAFGVSHRPTMLLFRAGKVVRRLVGEPLPDGVETMLRAELSHRIEPR